MVSQKSLVERFPPSDPCACTVCLAYCQRPGWWTVDEAARAIEAGYSSRMMLEMSPDKSFGVLAPAFRGCEGNFALAVYADAGCTFLNDSRCELFGTGVQPLECRYCHHDRANLGTACHLALESDWETPKGRSLVVRWSRETGFLDRQRSILKKI